MGSKKVKAIVLDTAGCERPESVDKDALRAAIKTFAQEPREIAGFREVEALVAPGRHGGAVPADVAVASSGTLGGSGRYR